ncbi:HAMP domain-containing histidine kinase, partial [Candidatus Bipolaricaulota bacterium]|nr:HAMP domain-containing histidine kinase [Candidatus Bipolaricaulota bacterium]
MNLKKIKPAKLFKFRISLNLKLVIAFSLLVALAIGTMAYVATFTTRTKFDQFLTRDQLREYNRQLSLLSNFYRNNGESWEGVQSLIDEIGKDSPNGIVLTGLQGDVIGKHDGDLFEDMRESSDSWLVNTLTVDSEPIGKLYLVRKGRSAIAETFLGSVNRSVIMAAIVAGFTGLLIVLFFSKTIVGPLRKLAGAVREFPKNRSVQRVDVGTEDEVGELAEAFNTMVQDLQEKEKLRQNLVSDVAHELRNPTSNLRGYLESLKNGVMEPDQEILESLHEESVLLHELIDDLQDLAQAEAGRLDLDTQPVSLEKITSHLIDYLKPRADEKKISLSTDFPDGPEKMLGDPGRLTQVLRNLLKNAISHTPENGEVTVTVKNKGKYRVIAVSDNGEGIPREDLPYVFKRFYRVDKSRSRLTGGSGLGLTIAKKIIQAHGGEIFVNS